MYIVCVDIIFDCFYMTFMTNFIIIMYLIVGPIGLDI